MNRREPLFVAERRAHLAQLYRAGMPLRDIALVFGGTEQGVRSTVRKMVKRGELTQREPPKRGAWK